MKKGISYLVILMFVAMATISCKQTIQDAVNNQINTALYSQLKSGYWTISVYKANSIDSVQIFRNWVTYFNDNNVMLSFDTTAKPRDTTFGTWSSADLSHFTCTFPATAKYPLNRLTDNWTIDGNGTNLTDRVAMVRYTYGHKDSLVMNKHPF